MNIILESYVAKIGSQAEHSRFIELKNESIELESHVEPIATEVTYTDNIKSESRVLNSHFKKTNSDIFHSKKKVINIESHASPINANIGFATKESKIATVEVSSNLKGINSQAILSPYRFPVTYDVYIYYMENRTNVYHID